MTGVAGYLCQLTASHLSRVIELKKDENLGTKTLKSSS